MDSPAARFEEAAKLAQDRLSHVRSDSVREAVAAGGLPAQEALSSLCWIACMLLTTAEEALRTKDTLTVAGERRATDQIERFQLSLVGAQRDLAAVVAERDSLRDEVQKLGSRVRKDGLTTRQRQAKDAARIVALTEQSDQLHANLRLSESAWAEERRAEQVREAGTHARLLSSRY